MSLEQKLKTTFDPSKIEPVIIDGENFQITVDKLRLFDEKLDYLWNTTWGSMRTSIKYSMKDSLREILKESMHNFMNDSTRASMRGSMRISIRNSMWNQTRNSTWDSIHNSIWDSMWDSTNDQLWTTMNDSMKDQMWASICVNLSKDEYESLFEEKEFLYTLPYERVREICDLYHWFAKQGLFIHRSFKRGDYILASWNNPIHIQILNILGL